MARGKSGRIVLEIDPELKKDLYLELTRRDKTLKEWFVAEANNVVYNSGQTNLFEENSSKEKSAEKPKKKKKV